MLIETVVLALVLGNLKGGKLSNLAELKVKGIWLLALAIGMQIAVYIANSKGFSLGPTWFVPSLHTLSYGVLILFTLLNYSVPGMKFIALGILLNVLVIGLNHGAMPVDPTYLTMEKQNDLLGSTGSHALMTEATSLAWLADRFFIAIPWLGKQLFSIGDIVIDIGGFTLIYNTLNSPRTYRIKSLSIR